LERQSADPRLNRLKNWFPKGDAMEYIKPEIIEIDTGMAGGQACTTGPTNYSTGCQPGPLNSAVCDRGVWYGSGPDCRPGGQPQSGNCAWGFTGACSGGFFG